MRLGGHRRAVLLAATLSLVAACTNSGTASPTTRAPSGSTQSSATQATNTQESVTAFIPMTEALPCDPLDEKACLLPWPNDAFTVPDSTTPTGRRVNIQADSTPTNTTGVHIDVTDQNRADGFSPGSAILTFVPGIDTARTGIAPSTDVGASLHDDAPVVLLDTTSGKRLAYWGELDAPAPKGEQLLMIHPAAALPEGHHVIVVLRNLKTADGAEIARGTGFQAAIDGTPEPPERATPFKDMFATLAQHGVTVDANVFLAWDFTVESAESLSGRILHMRQQAYAELAGKGPTFTVTSTKDELGVRTIDGTFAVPNYLTNDGSAGNRFTLDATGMPVRNATHPYYMAPFHCLVPLAAKGDHPTIVYGHGLLGTRMEAEALRFAPADGLAGVCATDEIGMSSDDVGNLATILGDLSKFPEQADRMQQGMLNQQYLGRLLNTPTGFNSAKAFHDASGKPLITVGNTVWVGNSQGGVLGGAISAVSSEWTRAVLGVPGMDYSLLLPRSSDWPEFEAVFDKAYTNPIDRVIALQLIQQLWDRGENDGYAQHLTSNTYPGIPAKQVLMIEAFGDHQVANVSTEMLARTIGASTHTPILAKGRSKDMTVQWGIPALDLSAKVTAALVLWDYGTPAPPPVDLPPTEPAYGKDPHGAGSHEPLVLQQALTFLITGKVIDVCSGKPCTSTALNN